MSADDVDRGPTRRSGASPAGPDSWDRRRSVIGWDVAFWLMLAIAALRILFGDGSGGGLSNERQWVALNLLVVLGIAYAVLAQRPGSWARRGVNPYLYIAIPVLGVLCYLDPNLGFLLFVLYPQVWVFCESTRAAVVLTVVLTVVAGVGFSAAAGWARDELLGTSLSLLVSLLFSLLLGIWISGVIRQSKDRAILIEQLEATRSELAEAEHAQGVMAERERVAREIHDTLAQGFTSVVMLSQAAAAEVDRDPARVSDRLSVIEAVARENLAEARALVAAFSPVGLDGSSLADAVRRLAGRFGAETGLDVDVEASGELAGLGRDREVVLLRAAQEALTNVRRHANARHVTVRLVAEPEGARVEVRDDGIGFEVTAVAGAARGGFGLAGMRGRVREAGGDVDIASEPGRGTRVTVRVPLAIGGPS